MTEGATSAPGGPSLLERVAAALASAEAGTGATFAGLAPPQRARLLRLARDIAHTGERQDAPLASYLIGRFVERRSAEGASDEEALGEAARLIEELTVGASATAEDEGAPRGGEGRNAGEAGAP
jgi:hypothetical protein